jgi:membrane-associated phospholipid phosphatase
MRIRLLILLIGVLFLSQRCAAQENARLSPGDAVEPAPLASGSSSSAPASSDASESGPAITAPVKSITPEREVSWRLLVPNLLQDQAQIWKFPVSVARGRHLKPTLAIIGITAAIAVSDERIMMPVRTTHAFDGFNGTLSGFNTATAMEVFPAAFYALALIRKDAYGQNTVLLAGEAVIDSEIVTTVLKDIDRRYRPNSVPPGGDLSASWFKQTKGSYIGGMGSFPSGHTIAAFSIATVFADRYPHPVWHVWLAYGLAGLVGFSRVTTQSHFPSDVFAGAALGYAIAHYVVRHPHEVTPELDMLSTPPDSTAQTAVANSQR